MSRSERPMIALDGNEAAARVAYLTNEVIAIYPITPASSMGEWSDTWSAQGRPNLWGAVPEVVELQSEGGAAGTLHGALQTSALATTFTASQGLLLMIPDMYKIAGELTPSVIHVAARSLATHALSIFGDHNDVMAVRGTGFAMLASSSVQESMDMAAIAQATTLSGRVPVVHFFDGFRTSHEINKIDEVDAETLRGLIDAVDITAYRSRAMSPERPVLRGTSQNPDVYFQSREAANPYYDRFPDIVQAKLDRFADLTGRRYHLYEYEGSPQADRVIVLMGSGAETVRDTVTHLNEQGESVGVLKVRLYRPFDGARLVAALPRTVKRMAVLDRSKEPGSDGEPLYKDVVTAIAEDMMATSSHLANMPQVIGGRYGLSSKEFTPAMVAAVFANLARERPQHPFTIGIEDDLTHLSLDWEPGLRTASSQRQIACVFYGLGSDGTVSANKNSIKIIAEGTDQFTQGYFVYDSKKSGAMTVSHLRFGPDPIEAPYLIGSGEASFVACHQAGFLDRYPVLEKAASGATFLLNSNERPEDVWGTLPREAQETILERGIRCYVIDGAGVATQAGLGRRINTVMQTAFFLIAGVLPPDEAVEKIKDSIRKTYGSKGRDIVEKNFRAVDMARAHLHEVPVPQGVTATRGIQSPIPETTSDFVRSVTAPLVAGRGDELPVSRLPADGTFPLGTAAYEKRNIATEIPMWEPDLCIQCGKCVFVCPHSTIRTKLFDPEAAGEVPETFQHVPAKGKGYPSGWHVTYQVAPEDCTGCTLCVEVCPARDKTEHKRKALNMVPVESVREQEKANWDFFLSLPEYDRTQVRSQTLKDAMQLQPRFEFSGACSGCGETPYIRLATQLFGDRMLIANATGCSSIYGGNLPSTPYTTDGNGHGPAWNNSLFEDNAEFGLGYRIALDQQRVAAMGLLKGLASQLGDELVTGLIEADQSDEAGIHEQRERLAELRRRLSELEGGEQDSEVRHLQGLCHALLRHSVWSIGGDGWAYDIGFGGVDHALSSGRDINFLVLDTEVYSNTGGQRSKSSPLGSVSKYAAGGKATGKKDLALLAMDHEHVYVARVAYGAKDTQTLRAFLEADAYPGPSLIIAYSPCIAHGVDLKRNHEQQRLAVASGHWPLLRYHPQRSAEGLNPLELDSKEPSIPFRDFARTETRFRVLEYTHPENSRQFMEAAQQEVLHRYHRYQQLAGLPADDTETPEEWKESDQ